MTSPVTENPELPPRRGAVAVVVRGDRFLVIRRSQSVPAPGMYCFPGGGIEGEETEAQAVIRELQEELGVAVRPTCKVWHCLTRWRVDLAWWRSELDLDAAIAANPAEVESVHWMTVEEMLSLDNLLETNRHFLQALAAGEVVLE